MNAAARSRGQPLLVLAALIGAWLALRVALWQPAGGAALLAAPGWEVGDAGPREIVPVNRRRAPPPSQALSSGQPRPPRRAGMLAVRRAAPRPLANGTGEAMRLPDAVHAAAGSTLVLTAGLSRLDVSPSLAAYLQRPETSAAGIPAAAPAPAGFVAAVPREPASRWSADAWLLLRRDASAPLVSGVPSYGRSQAGAVVRYRIAPSSAHRPQAYLRASSALGGPLERDLATGLSARPIPQVPVRLGVETRVTQTRQGTDLRPAIIAVTELPPARLPVGLRAEAYLQGGYVGGSSATGFVDGQARVERTVVRLADSDLTAGAAAWGGAQDGASRLDLGPTAALSFRVGQARVRLAADYRIRVAGSAAPGSGPALTLSAGF